MNVIKDYKLMLSKEYIDETLLEKSGVPEIRNQVERLYSDIIDLENKCGNDIKDLLNLMTKLYCYKLSLKMNVTGSVVPDAKDSDNKYVQARGAVIGLNNKRMWISHYLGPEGNYVGKNGKLIPVRIKNNGRAPLILKTLDKLLSQINEL